MKLNYISISNTKSFGTKVELTFDNNLNIFIGPNAGGKSNLLDIVNIVINEYLTHFWTLHIDRVESGNVINRRFIREGIFGEAKQALEPHDKLINQSQEIKITLTPENEDVTNLKIILSNAKILRNFEDKNFTYKVFSENFRLDIENINEGDIELIRNHKFSFIIKNSQTFETHPKDTLEERQYHIFLNYLRFFEVYSILIDTYNELNPEGPKIQRLYPPLCYFSPYRAPQIQSLVTRLSGTDKNNLKKDYRKATSRMISSTLNYANFHFASKLRLLNNNFESFQNDEEVKLINKYLQLLGYKKFSYTEMNPFDNVYQGNIQKQSDESLEVSKASSGEKEILNLLLGMFAFNVKNGVVIMDEPELHLHPKWQNIFLELFEELAKDRGIQFFLATHSPHFVTEKSIKSVFRVYSENGESKVSKPNIINESDKDLFQFINVFNNTKVFFAEKVILVEGYVDQIILDFILRLIKNEKKSIEVIEILNVIGKENLNKFQKFLKKWEIRCYAIADNGFSSDYPEAAFVLSKNDIQEYFPGISNGKFGIAEALRVANDIRDKKISIPPELMTVLEKTVNN